MTKITENTIENFCIKLLEKQGYEYIYAPNITPKRCSCWIYSTKKQQI